jgi:hypothetical protein
VMRGNLDFFLQRQSQESRRPEAHSSHERPEELAEDLA